MIKCCWVVHYLVLAGSCPSEFGTSLATADTGLFRILATGNNSRTPHRSDARAAAAPNVDANDDAATEGTNPESTTISGEVSQPHLSSRRRCLADCLGNSVAAMATAVAVLGTNAAHAATPKESSPDEASARARFGEGLATLEYLLDNFEEIRQGENGGDNIRRYLGTVGTTSGLVGIDKTMKTLLLASDTADNSNMVETIEKINAALTGADGAAYATGFTQSRKEDYYERCREELERALDSMRDLALMMGIR